MRDSAALRQVMVYQLAAWLAAALVCAMRWPQALGGVIAGGLLMAINVGLMRVSLNALGGAHKKVRLGRAALWMGAKGLLLLLATGLLLAQSRLSPEGLLLGFATLFFAIAATGAQRAWPRKGAA